MIEDYVLRKLQNELKQTQNFIKSVHFYDEHHVGTLMRDCVHIRKLD